MDLTCKAPAASRLLTFIPADSNGRACLECLTVAPPLPPCLAPSQAPHAQSAVCLTGRILHTHPCHVFRRKDLCLPSSLSLIRCPVSELILDRASY